MPDHLRCIFDSTPFFSALLELTQWGPCTPPRGTFIRGLRVRDPA